jgi:membrane protease YdiL (CAAX protease family)
MVVRNQLSGALGRLSRSTEFILTGDITMADEDYPQQLTPEPTLDLALRAEAPWALVYFALYVGWLFMTLENEFLHWVSMVIIPLAILYSVQKIRIPSAGMESTLATVGIKKGNLTSGILWAIVIGLALSALQLVLSRNRDQIWSLIVSGKAVVLFPITFVLMLFTAATTEEFFFRGVLQTRLQSLFRSKTIAVIVASLLFGLYHLPYAYLNPRWPSHGNWPEAFGAAFGQGIPIGLILGVVYVRTKNNLLACIMIHALLDSLPAMLSVKIQGL